MSDHDLAKYIPRYGDRVAVVAFCREHQSSDGDKLDKKTSLVRESKIKTVQHFYKEKTQRRTFRETHGKLLCQEENQEN